MKKSLLLTALLALAGTAFAQAPAPAPKQPATGAAQIPAMPQMKPATKEQELELIKSHMAADDLNKDGKVSLKEFMERPTAAFKKTDLNGDGVVTPEEVYERRAKERVEMEAKLKEIQKEQEEKAKQELAKNAAEAKKNGLVKPNLAPAKPTKPAEK